MAGPTHGKKGMGAKVGLRRARTIMAEKKYAQGGPIKPIPTGRRLMFNKAGQLVSRPNGKRKRSK